MAKPFDLAALMTENGGKLSNLDSMQIEDIEISKIIRNDKNFYSVNDVEDLKDSIELLGLQQPLVVVRNQKAFDGWGYQLIAGHRRLKAVTSLGWVTVPCIVMQPMDEPTEELALIMTNSTARELTYYERTEQVKRTEQALLALKAQGVKLPGKMRTRVAELTKESESEIARMKKIDANLDRTWMKRLKHGVIKASVAYEIAGLTPKAQKRLYQACNGLYGWLDARKIKAAAVAYEYDFVPDNCPMSCIHSICSRVPERAAYMEKHPECGGCCKNCENADGCPVCCGEKKKSIRVHEEAERCKQQLDDAELKWRQSEAFRMQESIRQHLENLDFADETELAALLGIDYWCIGQLIRPDRDRSASVAQLEPIAKLCGVSIPELLGFEVSSPMSSGWRARSDAPTEGALVLMCGLVSSGGWVFTAGKFKGGQFLSPMLPESCELPDSYKWWMPLTLPGCGGKIE